ncbi:acetolactate synthase [Deltaproteobacteria bacterium]|nr:acetolactate synthase [Deltaproteobacteria bacterium]
MEMRGSNILLECLVREGVEVIFGYPGGSVIDLYDKIPQYADQLRHVLVRHEQGAVHAADGYARASGKVGVSFVTSGPGATNTITGIATAYCDSIPLVVFTGQVPIPLLGYDAFQEIDIIGITSPVTKHSFLVRDIAKLPLDIRQAFHIARTGRPGPVVVDVPTDILQGKSKFEWPEQVRMRSYNPTFKANVNQLKRAAGVIAKAKRLLIMSGGGVIMADGSAALRELAALTHAPVTSTLMGLGAFDGDDPLWLGMPGMHGMYMANQAISHADVILAVGMRFDDRVTGRVSEFARNAKIVHIDVDPTSIHKLVHVDVPVVGDCRQAMLDLLELLRAEKTKEWETDLAAWHTQIALWREQSILTWQRGGMLKPQQVLEILSRALPDDAVIVTDVGQHQMWTAQFFTFHKPRSFLTSGGLGTMGYGLPAALGARVACPDRCVALITGDGSFQMNSQELMTAVQNKLPLKIFIINNGYLGMVRQWQQLFWKRNYVETDMQAQPDFVKLADAYGAEGFRVDTEEQLQDVLPRVLASPNLSIVDVRVEREENVYPMVPSGAPLSEMLLA